MIALAEFHFLRPAWLLALLPLLAGLIWFARRPAGIHVWQKVVEPHLLPHVLIGSDARRRRWPLFLIAIAGVLAVVAAAGPAWDRIEQPVFRNDDALVIVLDLSRSMDAEDVLPSRLQRARFKVNDILNARPDGQTALIVYAAQPFTVSPLTDDAATIVSQLAVLTTDLVPSQGSRVDRALVLAKDLLQQSGAGRGQVLVVTDGVDPDTAVPSGSELAASGYRVSVLGIGTPEGGPIPTGDGFLKDRNGAIVVARLATADLEALAAAGGGTYYAPTIDDRDVDRFISSLDASAATASAGATDIVADAWRDQGYWLLLPLLPLAAFAFRRGFLLSLSALLILPWPRAEALEWQDLWQKPDQQASEALEQGDAERAAALFNDPAWRAAAEYRAGQYDEALSSLSAQDGVDALYNRGNALARLERYEEAIEAYERAIEIDADHEDAIFNRDLLLDMQQQEQQQQSGEQGEQGEQQDQQDQQSSEQGEQGEQQQQAGDQGEEQEQQQQAGDRDGQQEKQQQAGDQSEQAASSGEPESPSDEEQARRDAAEQQFREEMRDAEARAAENAEQEQEPESEQLDEQATAAQIADQAADETQQAVEQWLRQVPDDPGGLLRRKFELQYRQQKGQAEEDEQW